MNKQYQIKAYNIDGTLKKTINQRLIRSNIAFSETKNGGQGRLDLELNLPFDSDYLVGGDFIKVYVVDENFPNGKLIYTGVIETLDRIYGPSESYISCSCVGLGALLTRVLYKSGSYVFTKTDTVSNIIKDIITVFNLEFPGNWITDAGVENTIGAVSIEFNGNTCYEAIQELAELTEKYWFIGADGVFTLKDKPTTPTHSLRAKIDAQNISISEDYSEIVNKAVVEYSTSTYETQDNPSITDNGPFQVFYSKSDIQDLATASDFVNETLAKNKSLKKEIEISVNSRYILENLKAGDTVEVKNINYEIKNLQIEKLNYNSNEVTLYLENFQSIEKVLKNNN